MESESKGLELISTGAVNWDVNLFVSTINPGGMEIPVQKITRVPGGKAANVAVAAARILGKGRAGILGAVGDDDIGRAHRRIFADEGVDTSCLVVMKGIESGQAYILIDPQGKNQIFTHFGANASLNPEFLSNEEVRSAIKDAKVLIAMDPPLEYTKELFKIAKHKDTIIWAPGVRSLGNEKEVLAMLSDVDYIVLNEQELRSLTGRTEPQDAYDILKKYSATLTLIATFGERGAILLNKKRRVMVEGIDLSRLGMRAVNTVGCGDAFIGNFGSALVEGCDEREALERGNAAGALKATKLETRGSPTLAELRSFLKRAKGKRLT